MNRPEQIDAWNNGTCCIVILTAPYRFSIKTVHYNRTNTFLLIHLLIREFNSVYDDDWLSLLTDEVVFVLITSGMEQNTWHSLGCNLDKIVDIFDLCPADNTLQTTMTTGWSLKSSCIKILEHFSCFCSLSLPWSEYPYQINPIHSNKRRLDWCRLPSVTIPTLARLDTQLRSWRKPLFSSMAP